MIVTAHLMFYKYTEEYNLLWHSMHFQIGTIRS